MFWNQGVTEAIQQKLSPRLTEAGQYLRDIIIAGVTQNKGEIPGNFSTAHEFPFEQSGGLAASILFVAASSSMVGVVSDAVDHGAYEGHHYSYDVEFGHWWDGWAMLTDGRIMKIARPHEVEPRPFMVPSILNSSREILEILMEPLQ